MERRNWLMQKRKDKNLLQREIAAVADITEQYYSMIEAGERTPSPDVAKKVAGYLGFPWTRFYE